MCTRQMRGSLGIYASLPLERHLDRFSHFAGLTGVSNKRTDRQTDTLSTRLGTGGYCHRYHSLFRPDKGSTRIQRTQTAKTQNVNTNLKSKNTELK